MEALDSREAPRALADGKTSAQSANPTVHEQIGVSVGSTGCPTASSQVSTVLLESDRAVPVPGNALAKSLTADWPEEDPAQSAADIRVTPPHMLPSIDNIIDQLTADLATLCIGATLGTKDRNEGDTKDLEDELQVRSKS